MSPSERDDLLNRLNALSPEKRRLVLKKLAEKQGQPDGRPAATPHTGISTQPAIQRDEHTARHTAPLSYAQQRLWFLEQLNPGQPAYHVAQAIHLRGAVPFLSAINRSLSEIVRRHEILRTTFHIESGEPYQRIHDPYPVTVQAVDLRRVPVAQREAVLAEQIRAAVEQPFDLARLPLARLYFIQVTQNEQVLLFVAHHIITDLISAGILRHELLTLVQAEITGLLPGAGTPVLPDLPVQYQDFARWQRQTLQGAHLEALIQHWKASLDGAPSQLSLPHDFPYPEQRQYHGAEVVRQLPARRLRGLHQLGALVTEEGEPGSPATLFMTLLAAYALALARFCGQGDLVIGSPLAGRHQPEVAKLLGFFVNTLPVRINLADRGPLTFLDVLKVVRAQALGVLAHQDLPFDLLVEHLAPARHFNRSPVYQVIFAYTKVVPLPDLGPVTHDSLALADRHARYDLALNAFEEGDRLRLVFTYSTELFAQQTIQALVDLLEKTLEEICADARAVIWPHRDAPAAVPSRPAHLGWVDEDLIQGLPLHRWFERQAARTPGETAIFSGDQEVSYQALNAQANRLAHLLVQSGLQPGDITGVCLPQGPQRVAALLAVMKAGGAFWAIDPALPPERLAFQANDADPRLVLVDADTRSLATWTVPLDLADNETQRRLAEQSSENLAGVVVTPEDLIYIMYTSGSTGLPKGALLTHAGAVNRLRWMIRAFDVQAADCFLQKASLSFDASIWETFVPLISGARLTLLPDQALDLPALAAAVRRYRVTILHFVPSVLSLFLDAPGVGVLPSLRLVWSGGEALSFALQERFFTRQLAGERPTALYNGYGPTEAAINAACWPCRRGRDASGVPIGFPLSNYRLRILAENGQEAPTGMPGELYIGGPGVARGYHRRPELTAERFVADPFAAPGQAAGRLYRTGDRVRQRHDGALLFLGRVDDQVKIGGVRIEPGEVEHQLRTHPAIQQAVVFASPAQAGGQELAAAVTVRPAPAALPPSELANQLRTALGRFLPGVMVPTRFLILEALPLTLGGKADRRRLITMLAGEGQASAEPGRPVEPYDPKTQPLVDIWEALLGRRAGPHESFFALGGHSLLSVRMLMQVEKTYGVRIPLQTLFADPTIAGLARAVEAAQARPAEDQEPNACLVTLQPLGRRTPFYCVHPIGGQILAYRALAEQLGPGQPFIAIQAVGASGEEKPLDSIPQMAVRYLAEIQAAQPKGPYRLGGWSLGGVIAYEMACQLQASGAEVSLLALIDSYAPILAGPHAPNTTNSLFTEDRLDWLLAFSQDLGRYWGVELAIPRKHLANRPQNEQLQQVLQAARDVGALSNAVGLESLAVQWGLYQAHRQALLAYLRSPQADPFRGRTILYRAERREPELGGLVAALHRFAATPDQGWQRRVQGELRIIEIPGDHYTILQPPGLARLAAGLAEILEGS